MVYEMPLELSGLYLEDTPPGLLPESIYLCGCFMEEGAFCLVCPYDAPSGL